jgi:hypothetical protein
MSQPFWKADHVRESVMFVLVERAPYRTAFAATPGPPDDFVGVVVGLHSITELRFGEFTVLKGAKCSHDFGCSVCNLI